MTLRNRSARRLFVTPFLGEMELELVTASADLGVTPLPNGETLTYTIEESTDDTTFTALHVLSEATLTGAGGTGATAKTVYTRLPSDVSRYVRVSVVSSGSAGDSSAATMTLKALF